jgi:hypothetical protein
VTSLAAVPAGVAPDPAPPRAPLVALGPSTDPNAKVTLVCLGPAGARAVIKLATTATAAARLAGERRALIGVRARCADPRVLATLPEPLPIERWHGHPALVCTAVPGVAMTVGYHRPGHTASPRIVERDLAAAGRWLAAFQQATVTAPPAPVVLGQHVVAQVERRYAGDPVLAGIRAPLRALAAELGTARTPLTATHGDFWAGNLLLRGDEITGVVDWEAAGGTGGTGPDADTDQPAGAQPVRDLVRFALSYALYLDRHTRPGRRVRGHRGLVAGRWGTGIAYALGGHGWFPALLQGFLRDGLRRLDADPDLWRRAALVGLAEIAAQADHPDFARRHLVLLADLLPAARS